jgi:hypothetical protein
LSSFFLRRSWESETAEAKLTLEDEVTTLVVDCTKEGAGHFVGGDVLLGPSLMQTVRWTWMEAHPEEEEALVTLVVSDLKTRGSAAGLIPAQAVLERDRVKRAKVLASKCIGELVKTQFCQDEGCVLGVGEGPIVSPCEKHFTALQKQAGFDPEEWFGAMYRVCDFDGLLKERLFNASEKVKTLQRGLESQNQ